MVLMMTIISRSQFADGFYLTERITSQVLLRLGEINLQGQTQTERVDLSGPVQTKRDNSSGPIQSERNNSPGHWEIICQVLLRQQWITHQVDSSSDTLVKKWRSGKDQKINMKGLKLSQLRPGGPSAYSEGVGTGMCPPRPNCLRACSQQAEARSVWDHFTK
jgi:hypothetical protein